MNKVIDFLQSFKSFRLSAGQGSQRFSIHSSKGGSTETKSFTERKNQLIWFSQCGKESLKSASKSRTYRRLRLMLKPSLQADILMTNMKRICLRSSIPKLGNCAKQSQFKIKYQAKINTRYPFKDQDTCSERKMSSQIGHTAQQPNASLKAPLCLQ